jgi:hypothetical protein
MTLTGNAEHDPLGVDERLPERRVDEEAIMHLEYGAEHLHAGLYIFRTNIPPTPPRRGMVAAGIRGINR